MSVPTLPETAFPPGFDVDSLLELVGDDVDFLIEIASLFEKDASRLLSEIRRAAGQLDGEGLERAAHALKGLVSHFGETKALDVCATLERLGLERAPEGAEALSEDLTIEIALIRSGLEQLTSRTASSRG